MLIIMYVMTSYLQVTLVCSVYNYVRNDFIPACYTLVSSVYYYVCNDFIPAWYISK